MSSREENVRLANLKLGVERELSKANEELKRVRNELQTTQSQYKWTVQTSYALAEKEILDWSAKIRAEVERRRCEEERRRSAEEKREKELEEKERAEEKKEETRRKWERAYTKLWRETNEEREKLEEKVRELRERGRADRRKIESLERLCRKNWSRGYYDGREANRH